MAEDRSNGWEAVAEAFLASRSPIGAATVRTWARALPRGGAIIDVGCGSGEPVSAALVREGFTVAGVDASPTLVAAFARQFPNADVACEPAESSDFFGRKFDAAVSVGLVFLLSPADQDTLIHRIARSLKPGGRLLFSAPMLASSWEDSLTKRRSQSLGAERYLRILANAGMTPAGAYIDEGDNHYFDAVKEGRRHI